ncbi:MAG: DUF1343 domain-containing protein [Bacteroidales bacterium]|nr:DUF1343 domain-containing protein [Bacteroidales bacterium]MCL2133282.1 DUF1343 domain-containing protein [Bacteroidales bacterium]
MNNIFKYNFIISLLLLLAVCHLRAAECVVGAAQFDEYISLLQGKRVGITANHTSLVGDKHLVDVLLERGINIVGIYSPEHGFRGAADAGAHIASEIDAATGIPIISLYGKNKKPRQEQLQHIDYMVFDMQDVGLRFFTYLSTLHYVMEACAEQHIPLLILDRPNPNGFYVDGPVLESQHRSFVGMHPIPVVHGMTLGELAQMINGEGWLNNGAQCEVTIIPCKYYTRQSLYRLPIKPSPNLPNMQAVYLYASLCFFEGTAISLGRGTEFPFQVFGHPDFKAVYSFSFTPKAVEGAINPPLKDKLCYGVDLRNYPENDLISNPHIRLEWLLEAYKNFSKKGEFFTNYFTTLWGTARVQKMIEQGASEQQIRNSWKAEVERFLQQREKYLLYE